MYYKSMIVCGLRLCSRCFSRNHTRRPPGGAGGRDRHPRVRGNALPPERIPRHVRGTRARAFVSSKKRRAVGRARASHAIAVSFAAALFLLFFFFTFFVTVFFFDFFGAAADRTAVACTGRPSANRRVWSPSWELARRPRPVAVIADASVVRRSVIHRSAPPMSWYRRLHDNPRYAPMPSTDVLRSGTGTAGSKSASLRLCRPTSALFRPWNTPPVAAPSALSSSSFTPNDAARVPIVYWRSGPQRSNALLGIESMTRCHPYLCAAPNERAGVRHHTVIAFATESCRTLDAAKSHSALRRSPRCAASYAMPPPMVIACSKPSFHRNAGSAMRRPMNARDTAVGVERDTRRTTEGRTSTDMNRTSCDDDTMPILIAMRIAAGSVVSVLSHSCITALMASRSYISPRGARVVRKLESPSSSSPSS